MSFVVNNSYLYNRCATWTLYNQVLSHRISGGQHQKFQSPIRPMLHVFDIVGPSNPLPPPSKLRAGWCNSSTCWNRTYFNMHCPMSLVVNNGYSWTGVLMWIWCEQVLSEKCCEQQWFQSPTRLWLHVFKVGHSNQPQARAGQCMLMWSLWNYDRSNECFSQHQLFQSPPEVI